MKAEQLKAIEQTLALQLEEATKPGALYEVWRPEHERIVSGGRARGGVEPGFVVAADRDRAKPPQQAEGMIVSLYDYRREAVLFALRELRDASPVRSGAYRNSHTVFVNRRAVGTTCPPLRETDDVFIANPLPYARRLEIGRKKSGAPFVVQVLPRIYERIAKGPVRQRYKGVAEIAFNYVDLNAAHIIKGKLGPTYLVEDRIPGQYGPGAGKIRKRRQQVGKAIRFPAIFFRPLGA